MNELKSTQLKQSTQTTLQPIEPCMHGNVKNCPYCDDATRDLPIPHGKGREIFPLVLLDLPNIASSGLRCDLLLRRQYGIDTYGEPLTAFNGRDIEVDTLQDGLDYVVYLRQCMEEGLNVDECYWLAIESIVLFYKITGR